MRAPTILNLRAETPVASSFTNGNSFGLLREPAILPFPYRLPSVKKPRFLRCGSIQSEVRPLQLEVRDQKCVLSPFAAALETRTCSGRTSRVRAGRGGRFIWRLCLARTSGSRRPRDLSGKDRADLMADRAASPKAAVIVGRRGGKSRTLALDRGLSRLLRDYEPYLAAGEVATIGVLAVDKGQARAIFRFVHGLLKAVPMLEPLIVQARQRDDRIVATGCTSRSAPRPFAPRAVIPMRRCCATSSRSGARTRPHSIPMSRFCAPCGPAWLSIPGAVLLMASSPYAQRGELFNAYRKHFGKDDARVLVWKSSTLQMNPRARQADHRRSLRGRSGKRQGGIWRRIPHRSGRFRLPRDGRRGDHGGPFRAAA